MFRSATFKLTVWYLAIITAISLIFSIVIYRFAVNELKLGLYHQTMRIYRDFPVFNGSPLLRSSNEIALGSHNILFRLIYFNVIVLGLAGVASYFLARRTLQPIEEAHARQQRFTADVSHELRTPLTALKMTSEVALLDHAAGKDDLRNALTSNIEEATKMDVLINNLLRLTRLDDAETQSGFSTVATTDLITQAMTQVTPIAEAKKIRLSQDGPAAELWGDPASLVQLLVILLDNAIKYSPTESTVALATSSKADQVQISISDNGPGISKDALPHVFDRFYRADSSRTRSDTSGYGLGLSIAKLIADRHNGQILLSSRPGLGTTATITLPAQSPASSGSERADAETGTEN